MSFTRLSPAERLGYEPCPKCGGRRFKSSIAKALSGGLKCDDPFHDPCTACGGTGSDCSTYPIQGCRFCRGGQ